MDYYYNKPITVLCVQNRTLSSGSHEWFRTRDSLKANQPISTDLGMTTSRPIYELSVTDGLGLPVKEVIQPHLPVRLPCYDFTPVTSPAVGVPLLAVRVTTSGNASFHGVTGGVYKARERIHPSVLIWDY